jgi:hypothetical protein
MLCIGFYFLRLGGQGLMVHTALTATARQFPLDAGKALGAIALGAPAGAGRFSCDCGADKRADGWRAAWGINAGMLVAGVGVALMFLPRGKEKPLRTFRKRGEEKEKEAPVWRNRNLSLAACRAGLPFITGFFFHQARLAQEKGWELSWVAVWFIAYAITQAVSLLSFGPLIDRLTTQAAAVVSDATGPGHAGAMAQQRSVGDAFYLIMTGVSSAIASTLATALWVQLFGPAQLARCARRLRQGR